MKDNLSSGDFAKVQDIVRLEAANKLLYQQVVLQSVQYNDCDIIALAGKFDPDRNNAFSHVHPLIAALYLPKFDVLERTTIHAHMAGVVKARYNREPLLNQVDKELFENIIYTNRREVCSMNPAEDLHKRVQLQYALWHSISALRSGRYYGVSSDFGAALEQCHLTHVSPHNTIVNDEGSSVRRIFGAFGLNTIMFSIKSAPQLVTANLNMTSSIFVPTVRDEERTSFDSMITIDMSDYRSRNGAPYDFNDALNQQSYYLDENDRYILANTNVIGVHKLMSFFVSRRKTSVLQKQNIGSNGITASMISFNQLPLTISGLSELNSYPVHAPLALKVNNFLLQKRSVVVNEVIPYSSPNSDPMNPSVVELVTSTSAIVYKKDGSEIYYYNPTGVLNAVSGVSTTGAAALGRPNPVSLINSNGANDGSDLNAAYLESRQGTLFFYQTSD